MVKTIIAWVLGTVLAGTTRAQVPAENEFLKLEFDQGVFHLTDKASGKPWWKLW